jgi:hypothetical protein
MKKALHIRKAFLHPFLESLKLYYSKEVIEQNIIS